MVRLLAALVLLGALSAEAQLQTQPTGLKKMDGSDSGGGGGSGTVTSVGNGTIGPLFGASWATATTTPALSLNLAAQAANCILAGPASGGNAVPTCRSLVAADIGFTLNQNTSGNAATATALAANPAACSAGQYVSDVAADGTLTCSAVTGTLSGLTATKIPVATSGTAAGDTAITYSESKVLSAETAVGRKICFTDSAGSVTCLGTMGAAYIGQGFGITKGVAADSAVGDLYASTIRLEANLSVPTGVIGLNGVSLYSSAYAGGVYPAITLANGESIGWSSDTPDTQIQRDAAGQLGIYGTTTTYGQLNVGTDQLVDTGTKPACDSAHRGQRWYDAGAGGVADTYEVCRKDAADAYAWVSVF